MTKTPIKPELWTPRPVEDTIAVYRDWADSYDDDLASRGYRTPARLATALAAHVHPDVTVLDYGCGTGVSGAALSEIGFTDLHGTDITPEMIAIAKGKALYGHLWQSEPGATLPRTYAAITAIGVVSLGAAPPETLHILIDGLLPNGVLALSFNDPTLEDGRYDAALQTRLDDGTVTVLARAHGPHLEDVGMGSDVILLQRI